MLNVPWIKVNNAAADIPASHESCAVNKTVKNKYMNYNFLFTKLPSPEGLFEGLFQLGRRVHEASGPCHTAH